MLHFNSKRRIAIFLLVIILNYSLFPYTALALTGGPSQPEVQSFEPAGTSEMVDLSTGSFTYNIPLLDVGGYPVNISYNAGATMDQEASCVGLGWNINPGVINRNMRGLPDDFDGEDIEKEFNVKPNRTWGANAGIDLEAFGLDKAKPGLQAGIFFNNYKGMGLEFGVSVSPALKAGDPAKDGFTSALGLTLNFNVNSQNGVSAGVQPSLNFSETTSDKEGNKSHKSFGLSGGLSFNSRQGLLAATLGANMSHQGVWSSSKNKDPLIMNTSAKGNTSFSFARPTYTPSTGMPMANFSFTLRGAGEVPIFGIDPGVSFSAYFSEQKLTTKKIISKGYGTLYLQNQKPGISLLDFNREKDGPFTNNTPNLAIPVATQDIYSVVGQGIGGSYLLKRSDVGVFSDKETSITSGSANVSLEFGAGNLTKVGVDISGVGVEAKTGAWKGVDNLLATNLAFKGIPSGTSGTLYEPAYFKQAGEQSVESDPTLFENLGGFDVIDAKIERDIISSDRFKVQVKPFFRRGAQLKKLPNNTTGVNSLISRSQRERRNQNISYLTAAEAKEVGLQKSIENYPLNSFGVAPTPIQRTDGTIRKDKHISEVMALREDGIRYVYGVPAYNIKQEDYSFSVSGSPDCSKGLVTYNGTTERGPNNTTGSSTLARDNFYSKEVTPAYAHSFLLSAVISPDYSDVDNTNGPSPGDLGSYTKFNYSRVRSNYKWRLPYPDASNRANYNPGLLSNPLDDRGSVVYGEKEIWQLHSIESKTHVARFSYSLRPDAISVTGIDQNTLSSGTQLYKLDKIELFSRTDLNTPIKTVFFTYDYTLCQGLPNFYDPNNPSTTITGKLTLKKIFFTYGISQKGRFSPYEFTYAGASVDSLKYNYQGYNRWGSFQLSKKTTSSCTAYTSPLGNDDYPYVKQDSLLQAKYAVAWNLTKIKLPSGGEIEVTYEAHDYANVQDKNAMQMFILDGLGISTDRPSTPSGELFTDLPVGKVQKDYVYFRLKNKLLNTAYTAQQAKDLIARDYLKDIISKGNLYFKCLVDLKTTPISVPHYEYVFGYADIVDWGRCTNSEDYGFIKLNQVCLKDKENGNCPVSVNPISKAGWQFTRLNYPDLIHSTNIASMPTSSSGQTATSTLKLLESMLDMFKQVQTTLMGPNRYCLDNNYSQKLLPTKSWIRLYTPDGKKSAGGSRVKRITIADSWKTMTSNTVDDIGKYGQEFSYRTELDLGKNIGDGITKRQISSGVATYEPMIGGDENPFRQPVTYDQTLRLAPDNRYYQESPFGESFFPAPQIIYSKVTVTTLRYDKSGILATPQCISTGQTVSEYYTAKDYPTRVSKTPIQVIATKSSPLESFLKLDYQDFLNASQGFCVELNDMSGKPKAQWNFDDKGTRISGVEYIYKSKKKDSDPSPTKTQMDPVTDSLDNRALVINRTGNVSYSQIGVDFQVITDSRESYNQTRSVGVATNADVFVFGIFPAAAIVPWPIFETEKTRFRSMAISKVINRYALLEKVVAYDASSRIETENLAYDAETGEVLLTRTFNEFGDPIYKLKYPAHFAYTGMRQAYENTGAEIFNVYGTAGSSNYGMRVVTSAQNISLFHPGDEVSIMDNGQPAIVKKGWVLNTNSSDNSLDIIGKVGEDLLYANNPPLSIKIIRSGKRNLQSAEIGMITLRSNPIDFMTNKVSIPTSSVLDASVTEYSDNWWFQNIGGCSTGTVNGGGSAKDIIIDNSVAIDVTNPYAFDRRGVWRPLKSWTYLTDRNPESPSANYQTNIRTSGTFKTFSPFWTFPSSQSNPIWGKSETNWTWSSEATKYNAFGFQLESKDPLGRYSSELPGYGNTQAIAVAANARYKEITYNGFEENSTLYRMCSADTILHFPRLAGGTIVSSFSHTGDYSLNVPPSGIATHAVTIKNFNPSLDVLTPAPIRETRLASVNNLTGFGMISDSVYLVSAWVRTDETYAINKVTYKQANNLNPRIEVKRHNGAASIATIVLHPTGNVIDGWQRIVGLVTAPPLVSGQPYVVFEFKNGTTSNAYFDDFRVQPFRSAMKTYVYDLKSTRLLATLDDENYATFYEYNQEGNLERVKRETEQGIMTIQENRTGIKKQ